MTDGDFHCPLFFFTLQICRRTEYQNILIFSHFVTVNFPTIYLLFFMYLYSTVEIFQIELGREGGEGRLQDKQAEINILQAS